MKPTESYERVEIYSKLKNLLVIVNGIASLALFHYTAYLLYSMYNFLF